MICHVCTCAQERPLQLCEVQIWCRPLAAVKILLQVFIIAWVWNSGSVVCAARLGGVMECLHVCWGSGGWVGEVGVLSLLPPLRFPPASPQIVAHCTLGNGEAYWSWLVPAVSQIVLTGRRNELSAWTSTSPTNPSLGHNGWSKRRAF